MHKLIQIWMKLIGWLSARGIPLPLLRDYKNNQPSVSLTMMVISFALCVMASIEKIAASNSLGGLSFPDNFNLFMATSALYFGRNLTGSNGTKVDVPENQDRSDKK